MGRRTSSYRIANGLEWVMLFLLCVLLVSQIAVYVQPAQSQSPRRPVSAITLRTAKAKLQYQFFGKHVTG